MTGATGTKPQSDAGTARPYGGILSECRELIRNRACAALASVRDALSADLEERKFGALDPEEEQMLADLQAQLRAQGEALEQGFAIAFDRVFSELSRKPSDADNLYQHDQYGEFALSLIDDQVFSEALTVKGQANVLHGACESELKDLLPRFALMLGSAAELEASDNPAGPETVSEALKEACWSFDCARPAKELLFEMMTRKLAPQLNAIYHEVNQHLVVRRVLPRIRTGPKRGGVDRKRGAQRQSTPEAEGGIADILKQLLAPKTAGEGPGFPTGAGLDATGGAANPHPGVMQMLNRLQQGDAQVELGDSQFNIDMAAAATMNVVQGLLDAGVGRHLGPVDNIVIDVVATLFDFIFDDERVPDAMKGLIGRMQLPVLKLALADHSFFSSRSHPARKLINAMAQSASTWDGELTLDSSLYRAAEPLVLRIQNEACDDSSIFTSCLETFETFLHEQEEQADQKAATLTSRLTVREQLEIARTVAEGAIVHYTGDDNVPETVRQFLATHWLGVLTDAARANGDQGAEWGRYVATMDDLVWSVRPKQGTDERQRLVKLLPGLLGGLRTGLEGSKVDTAVREAFFTDLVKLHAVAIRSAMAAPKSDSDPLPDPTTSAAAPQATAMAAKPPAPDAEPEPEELDELRRGTWIELRLESGERRAVRLTWISPARTMYLFANRQGQRALVLTRTELASKFSTGEALLADSEPLMDRLVADVLEDYQPVG